MKTTFKTVAVLSLMFAFAACNDDDSSPAISSEEAAEMAAASLAESSLGVTASIDESIIVTDEALNESTNGKTAACGYTESYSTSATNPDASLITYSYALDYSYSLSCGGGETPVSMSADVSYSGEFDAPRLASTNTGEGGLTISALDKELTSYVVNGTYSRTGSFTSKIRNKYSSTSTVDIALDDIAVDKTSKSITEGTASVSITGTVPSKGSFSFSASVTFNGDDTATVTIKGDKYLVDLETGSVEEL